MEELFIKTQHKLFVGEALYSAVEEERKFIQSEIDRETDEAVLKADIDQWASG